MPKASLSQLCFVALSVQVFLLVYEAVVNSPQSYPEAIQISRAAESSNYSKCVPSAENMHSDYHSNKLLQHQTGAIGAKALGYRLHRMKPCPGVYSEWAIQYYLRRPINLTGIRGPKASWVRTEEQSHDLYIQRKAIIRLIPREEKGGHQYYT